MGRSDYKLSLSKILGSKNGAAANHPTPTNNDNTPHAGRARRMGQAEQDLGDATAPALLHTGENRSAEQGQDGACMLYP